MRGKGVKGTYGTPIQSLYSLVMVLGMPTPQGLTTIASSDISIELYSPSGIITGNGTLVPERCFKVPSINRFNK